MAKYTATLTTNTSAYVCQVIKARQYDSWRGLFFAYGTFGGGTVAWQWSPDGGTTKLAMNDFNGNAVVSTANDSFFADMETGDKNNDKVNLYATLTGATSPSLTVGVYDNN